MINNFPIDLSDKIALVTGASSGLGEHFAKTLSKTNVKLVLTSKSIDKVRLVEQSIVDQGKEAISIKLDVTKVENIKNAFKIAEKKYGPVSILINNAGIASEEWFLKEDYSSWLETMDVNLNGSYQVAKEAALRMKKNQINGSIINISSILGVGVQLKKLSSYGVSKAAIIQLTKSMALELADYNIRVNAIAPGYFSTKMNSKFLLTNEGKKLISKIPQKRIGNLNELDGVLLLLASELSSFITGTVIPVDGGALLTLG